MVRLPGKEVLLVQLFTLAAIPFLLGPFYLRDSRDLEAKTRALERHVEQLERAAENLRDILKSEREAKTQALELVHKKLGDVHLELGQFRSAVESKRPASLPGLVDASGGLTVWGEDEGHLLVLTTVYNSESWGRNERTVVQYLEMIRSQSFPSKKMSVGLLISQRTEYEKTLGLIRETNAEQHFARIVVINKMFNALQETDPSEKYFPIVQRKRRSVLAQARNYLVLTALQNEEYVMWIDADIVDMPEKGMIQEMVDSTRDIITPSCHISDRTDYDWNSWAGVRRKPSAEQLEGIAKGTFEPFFEPGLELNDNRTKIVDTLRKEDPERVSKYWPLDSVGGTVLFLKADVHRKGALFSPFYIIGAQWEHTGWDGIETESLCYTAKILGYTCWAMPHAFVVHSW